MIPSLKASLWTSALIRQADVSGAFAAVVRKGDPDAGACLVKVRSLDGLAAVYRPVRNMDGTRVWWPKGPEAERDIDQYINTRIDDDPDIWVLEIEDRQGRHFITEPIEDV